MSDLKSAKIFVICGCSGALSMFHQVLLPYLRNYYYLRPNYRHIEISFCRFLNCIHIGFLFFYCTCNRMVTYFTYLWSNVDRCPQLVFTCKNEKDSRKNKVIIIIIIIIIVVVIINHDGESGI